MLAKLRHVCKNCKESSIRTYWNQIKALAKMAGHDTVPDNARWLTTDLIGKIKKAGLAKYKRFALAGLKALQAYGAKHKRETWANAVRDSSDKYGTLRDKGKRTEREARNWPEGGFKALTKLANALHEEVKHLEGTETNWSNGQHYEYQRYFIMRFYSKHALRGDLADVRVKAPLGPSFIKNGTLHVHQHKTSRSRGALKVTLAPEVLAAYKVLFKAARRNASGYLLRTLRTGNRMQRKDMLILIRRTTKERLGKNLGVQLIRVLRATESAAAIDEAAKLQEEMGHGASMQRRYVSRT
jgi:hypothetical protein